MKLEKKIILTLLPIGIQNVNPETSCHARNILRAIFRESSLGEDLLLWAEDALIISITGFGDESWALRNTSAMLYSTLCSRIFGTKKSAGLEDEEKISSSEFFNRFPKLEQFLLETVESSAQEMISNPNKLNPTLLPALLIIQIGISKPFSKLSVIFFITARFVASDCLSGSMRPKI